MQIKFPAAYRVYAKGPNDKKAAPISRNIWGIRKAANLIEADIFKVLNEGDQMAFIDFINWLNLDGESEYTFLPRKVKNWLPK